MKKILTYLFLILVGITACQDENDNTKVAELQKQIDDLKAVLEDQRSITDVAFEGNEMVLTFANGSIVRTNAPTTIIPYIGDNGNWWVNGEDLGVKAEAEIPTVGSNGNWWIGDSDTGVKAQGDAGVDGAEGTAGTGIESVNYDAETAVMTITLTDGTVYEYVLFYEEAIKGIKLGDLNGKYLLSGITNGDFPFADFVYNAKNQLTDINYFVSLLNAPVKNASLHRTYGTDDKVETQALVEYAIKDKAVQVGYSFPNSTCYYWERVGVKLTPDEAFNELYPSGLTNFMGTVDEFFQTYWNHSDYSSYSIKKDNFLYNVSCDDTNHDGIIDATDQGETHIYKERIRTNETKAFAISEEKGQKYIWTPEYYDWNDEFSWIDHYGGRDAYNHTDISYNTGGGMEIANGTNYYSTFVMCHPAVEYTTIVKEVTDSNVKDYLTLASDELDNPENITGNFKILYKEYNLYKQGDEINRLSFAYAYDGENQTISSEDENLFKLKVSDNKIDAVVEFDGETEVEVLKLNYVDGRLATISSPEHEVDDIVKVLYDSKNNPTEFQVNSKDLAGKGLGELLTNLGLAYRTDVYDENLGVVVEKYIYPEDYVPLLKMKYDYTMKNFMNHTITAGNPLLSVFNQENAIQEIVWAGHGNCFFAEYTDYNEGGYPQKVKGYLQLSPFYEYGDDKDEWDGNNQNDSFEYPINGAIATSYKLKYKKIEE